MQRIRGEGVDRALRRSDLMLLAILKARDPWFMPKPKEVVQKTATNNTVHANFSSTSITAGHLTDDELETMDRLLKKMGVPEHLLKAAPPIDTEPEGDR